MKAMMVARLGLNPSYACETAWLSIEKCLFRVPYAHRRLRTPGKQTRKCWRLGLALCRRDFATRSLVCACTNRLRRPSPAAPAFGSDVCLPRVKRRMGGRPVASSIINLCSFGCARLLPNFFRSVLQAIPGREGGHTVYSPWELEESRIDKLPLEANGKCCPGFAALQVPPSRICPHAALSIPIRHSSLAGAGADRCVGRCLFIYVSIVAFPHRLRA